MKITFYSNYLNHHQLPFCEALYKELGSDFVFCADKPTEKERLDGGWEDMNNKYPFVLKKYESKEAEEFALKLAETSDVIILGDSSTSYKLIRIKNNKFFFRESERIYKGKFRLKDKLNILHWCWSFYRNEKNSYLLCMGAYVKRDFYSFFCYKNRAIRFGYFPPIINNIDAEYKIINRLLNSFIWVGRLIKFKHPEYVLNLAIKLKNMGYKFKITMIGCGELLDEVKETIEKNNLSSYVFLQPKVNHNEMPSYYLSHRFHLFTSDREEGWGAVLNESMNCGCVAIANKEIGSVPFLIKNKVNGFCYKKSYKNFEKACLKAMKLNEQQIDAVSTNAFNTIKNEWNAKIAAKELLRISSLKLTNKKINFKKSGLFSKY